MLKLCAAAYEDGYAVYTEGDKMFMLRPPYRAQPLLEVQHEALGRAVSLHGFRQTDLEFDGLHELIQHLKAKWREASPLPSREEVDRRARETLREADARTLERFLTIIKTEMMPKQRWDKLQRILGDISVNKNLTERPDLAIKCCQLLVECGKQQNEPLRAFEEDMAASGIQSNPPPALEKVKAEAAIAIRQAMASKNRTLQVGTSA